MREFRADSPPEEFAAFNVQPKDIRVITLVEGQATENKTWTYDPVTGYIRGTNPSKCLHKKFGGWANGNLWYDFAVHKSSLLTAHLSIDTER